MNNRNDLLSAIKLFGATLNKNKSVMLSLAAIVVFIATYILILPAITLDKEEAVRQGGIDVPETEQVVETEQTLDGGLTFAGDGYSISAKAGESALPDGTELTASEVTPNDKDYEAWCDEALKALQESPAVKEDVAGLTDARFYDITLLSEGDVIEPESPVNVKISYDQSIPMKQKGDIRVIHFGVDKKGNLQPEVLKNSAVDIKAKKGSKRGTLEVSDVAFDASGFSMYAIVGTELYTEVTLPGSSDAYTVTVSAPAEAKIPQGSTLRVQPFEEDSEEYAYARKAVLADKKENGIYVNVDDFRLAALDISIIDPDGNEIEPSAAVDVNIRIKELPGVEDLDKIKESLRIQHHVEVEDGVIVENVFDGSSAGSFRMNTDQKIVQEGTAVDPASVSDNDFRNWDFKKDSIDASFETEVFSTFTISWNNAYGNGVKVHYVDEDGNELNVANSVFPSTIGWDSASPAHLIYDIDGYEYDHTYRRYYDNNRWNEQNIVPELRRTNSAWYNLDDDAWQYRRSNDNRWRNLSNSNDERKDEIYVVYKKKPDVTQGGSPTLKPVGADDYPEEPSILKESEANGDGTSDLSLSITGHTVDREVEKLADVIVVFDVSGSMSNSMSGSTRLQVAKNAVNSLVDNLATKKNSAGEPLVRMSLISFSNTATNKIGLTDLTTSGVRSYKQEVDNLRANGGTNWDYALQLANEQAVDSGRATFVIFVTDGDPTFRNTRTNTNDAYLNNYDINESYYLNSDYNVFGTGSSDNLDNNYSAAVAQGRSIVAANKNLYTIGISNDVSKVSDFNTDAGGNGAFIAANASALNQAFADIEASIIAKMGVSDIQMTDGITEMTQTVDKSGLTTTDGSFTYWKKAKNATSFTEWDPASEGCQEAVYDHDSGAVKWNMGTSFMPEDGATYKVTWRVWPNQRAYDILAMCENDPTYYDSSDMTDEERAQITRTGTAPNYIYTLRTNEPGAGIKYKTATKSGSGITTEGDYKTLEFNQVDPLGMDSDSISIQKEWENDLDGRDSGTKPITFTVKADDDVFDTVQLGPANEWKIDSFNISAGLMTTTGGKQVVYTHGHDFTIVEPDDLAYYWDFKADVYHPMVIDNEIVMLLKVDSEEEADYTIDGKYYKISTHGALLKAVNERRSYLNLSKTVIDQNGDPVNTDQRFPFTARVTESRGEDVWFAVYDYNLPEPEEGQPDNRAIKDRSLVTRSDGEPIDYQDSDGFFHVPSGTEVTIQLQKGWNVRFINLHTDSTYTFAESSSDPEGFSFLKTDATATNGGTPGTVEGRTTSGTIDRSNTSYSAAYTNRTNVTRLKLRKVDEDETTLLPGATLEIKKGHQAIHGSPFVTTQEDIELSLTDGVYSIRETGAPAGYMILTGDLYFKTANGTVTITDEDGNPTQYDDLKMITEDNVTVLKVINHPGQELPMTGGIGTTWLYLLGSLLLLGCGITLIARRRIGER